MSHFFFAEQSNISQQEAQSILMVFSTSVEQNRQAPMDFFLRELLGRAEGNGDSSGASVSVRFVFDSAPGHSIRSKVCQNEKGLPQSTCPRFMNGGLHCICLRIQRLASARSLGSRWDAACVSASPEVKQRRHKGDGALTPPQRSVNDSFDHDTDTETEEDCGGHALLLDDVSGGKQDDSVGSLELRPTPITTSPLICRRIQCDET